MNSTPLPFLPAELWNKIYDDKEIFEIAEAKKNHGIQLQLLHTEMIRKGDFELKGESYWDSPYYPDYKEGDIYEHIWVTKYLRCIYYYSGCGPSYWLHEHQLFGADYEIVETPTSLKEFKENLVDIPIYDE